MYDLDRNSLFINSDRGSFHRWYPDTNSVKSIKFSGNPTKNIHCRSMALRKDSSLVTVTLNNSSIYHLVEKENLPERKINKIFVKDGDATIECYALQEREDGIWLWNVKNKSIERIADLPQLAYRSFYDTDGSDHILGTGDPNFVLSLKTPSRPQSIKIPINICDIAGDTNSGFWLVDGHGSIFFLDQNYPFREIDRIILNHITGPKIYSWSGLVVWMGMCEHSTEAGADIVNVAVFYSLDKNYKGRLKKIGQRFFSVSDGLLQGITYDLEKKQLWFIWQNSTQYEISAKLGTPQEFISKKEYDVEIHDVEQDLSKVVLSPDGNGLYILSERGNLFRVNTDTLQVEAVMCANRPIEVMEKGYGDDATLFLAYRSHAQIIACAFIGGSE